MDLKLRQRLLFPALALLILLTGGTWGLFYLAEGQHSLFDCFYMVIITLTTVGYGEVVPLENNIAARFFMIFLMLGGMGVLLYLVTQLTAFFVEGDLNEILRRYKMQKTIEGLEKHVIVCGGGIIAMHVVRELIETRWDFIIVASDKAQLEKIERETEDLRKDSILLPHIIGDPTDDRTLTDAHIEKAHGVLAAMEDDKENLFITVAARQYQTKQPLRIIAQASDTRSIPKLKAAGADSVVSPSSIGGMRLASEMIRPSVVTFLDIMLKDKDERLRVEEISIGNDPHFVGKTLGATQIRDKHDLLVLAVQDKHCEKYTYKPKSDFILEDGMTLVVLGAMDEVQGLRRQLLDGQD